MIWTSKVSPLIKEVELRKPPVMIRVNKFDEKSAAEFSHKMAVAHSTGQKVIPIIIDSYGGQVYSLMSMIADFYDDGSQLREERRLLQEKGFQQETRRLVYGCPGSKEARTCQSP